MLNQLHIAQITDMHITETDKPFHGVEVRKQFLQVIQLLKQRPLDLLILSGDLAAEWGEIESYQWIKNQLADFPCPFIIMAGNHDKVKNLVQVFDLPSTDIVAGMLCFTRRIQGKLLIFLDSSNYTLPTAQLAWLATQPMDEQALLFIHHPPMLCGSRFMDAGYGLQNIEETWATLARFPLINHIFCGHYHTAKTLQNQDKQIYLTPSTSLQIDTQPLEFTVEHTTPGWRTILWQDSQVTTFVEYLDSNDAQVTK
jgi:Icc protein